MKAISLFFVSMAVAFSANAYSVLKSDTKVVRLPETLTVKANLNYVVVNNQTSLIIDINGTSVVLAVNTFANHATGTTVEVEGYLKDYQDTTCGMRHAIKVKGVLEIDYNRLAFQEVAPGTSLYLISDFQADSCHSRVEIETATYRLN